MQITTYHPTETATVTKTVTKLVPITTMTEVTEIVTETGPKALGSFTVYPVQYRNYTDVIHIQHAGHEVNRDYGWAFNIPGQAGTDVEERFIPSLAGTSQVYAYGTLVISGKSATLIGVNGAAYPVPLNTLPF